MSKKKWFESWFDSPYYHLLYQDRDQKEAKLFLNNLISFLKPPVNAHILDVACGRGRHALLLNKMGFDVSAFDLSPESISFDKKFENETLHFFVHDMREVLRSNYFNIVFNLFSSFGYFDNHQDNQKVIHSNSEALVEGGILVVDYMNSSKVKKTLIKEDEKYINGISFCQKRKISGETIIKEISFSDEGKDFSFEEHLQLYTVKDFEKLFSENNLVIKNVFGDYNLNPFIEASSDRLILIAQKL